jgi:hypothetical protein
MYINQHLYLFKICCRLIKSKPSDHTNDVLWLISEFLVQNQSDTMREIFLEKVGVQSLVTIISANDQIELRIHVTRILTALLLSDDSVVCEVRSLENHMRAR